MIHLMARKHYSSEFRRQAVDLFESIAGATFQGIAADLGITRGTLAHWVRALGTGTTTSPPGATTPGSTSAPPGRVESPAARLVRLEARVRELEAEKVKLSTEREILRSAAKYFAGQTNW
jgi:transposase